MRNAQIWRSANPIRRRGSEGTKRRQNHRHGRRSGGNGQGGHRNKSRTTPWRGEPLFRWVFPVFNAAAVMDSLFICGHKL